MERLTLISKDRLEHVFDIIMCIDYILLGRVVEHVIKRVICR